VNTQTDSVSLTQNLTPEEISLTVSLTGEDIPSGWMETVAIVRAPSTQQEEAKKKGAARQKKLEDKRRNEGLKKNGSPQSCWSLSDYWDGPKCCVEFSISVGRFGNFGG